MPNNVGKPSEAEKFKKPSEAEKFNPRLLIPYFAGFLFVFAVMPLFSNIMPEEMGAEYQRKLYLLIQPIICLILGVISSYKYGVKGMMLIVCFAACFVYTTIYEGHWDAGLIYGAYNLIATMIGLMIGYYIWRVGRYREKKAGKTGKK
jgi:hypothetical protein